MIKQAPAPKKGIPGDRATTVKIQADGKILALGYARASNSPYPYNFEVVRLTSAGVMDSAFGSGGRVQPLNGSPGDMALQPDGRIILVGAVTVTTGKGRSRTSQNDIVVVRLLASGALDTSFGQGGKVITAISGSGDDYACAVALQADGKIVVGGYTDGGSATSKDSVLLRYNSNGALDTSFGQGGKVVTAWSSGEDLIDDLVIQTDGRIVVTGKGYLNTTGNDFNPYFVARHNTNGSLDDGSAGDATPGDSFGAGGIVVTPFGGRYLSTGALALQSNGAIVFTRHSFNGTDNDIALACFTALGTLDASFGGGTGAVTVDLGGNQVASSVAVQGDGKILIAGYSDSPVTGSEETLLVRFQPDGALDVGFGSGGVAIKSFSTGPDEFSDIALQADGKIVAVGSVDPPTGGAHQPSFLIARYLGDSASAPAAAATQTPPLIESSTNPVVPMVAATDPDLTRLATEWLGSTPKRRRSALRASSRLGRS